MSNKIKSIQTKNIDQEYRFLLENASDAIFITDDRGQYLDVNKEACELSGYSREQLLKMNFRDLHDPEDTKISPSVRKKNKTGKPILAERSLKHKKGHHIPVETSSKQVANNTFIEIARDITKRKKIEDAIKKSEQFYRTLMEQASDAIFIADEKGIFIDVNKNGCKLLGYSKTELLSMHMKDIADEDDLRTNPFQINELFAGKTVINERTLRKKDGSTVIVEISAKMLSDNRLIAFKRNISRRKKIEESLRKSEEKYRLLAETAHDVIFVIDADDRVQYVNSFASKLLNKKPEEVIGRPRSELFPQSVSTEQSRSLQIVFETGMPMYVQGRMVAFNNWIWLDTSLAPIKDEEGNVTSVLGISRDVTEIKIREQLNQALNNINASITSTLDFETIMQKVIVEANQAMGCDTTTVNLLEGETWTVRYIHGLMLQLASDLVGKQFDFEKFKLSAIAIKTREVVISNDCFNDDRTYPNIFRKYKIRSAMLAPLYVRDKLFGTLFFAYNTDAIPFNDAQIDFAHKLAASLSLAIQNAQLFQEQKQMTRELRESENLNCSLNYINGIIHSTLDFEQIMQAVVKAAAKAIGCQSCVVLMKKTKNSWTIDYAYGFFANKIGKEVNTDEAKLLAICCKESRVTVSDNTYEDTRANIKYVKKNKMRSVLCVPLHNKGKVIGGLTFHYHSSVKGFTKPQIDFAGKLAHSLSLAIQNARLYESLYKQVTANSKNV